MTTFDLYGSVNPTIGEVCNLVASALSIEFSLRSSDYRGGGYFIWHGDGVEVLTVCRNFEDENGEMYEWDFPDYPVLVQVDGSERAEWIEDLLGTVSGLQLLRRIAL